MTNAANIHLVWNGYFLPSTENFLPFIIDPLRASMLFTVYSIINYRHKRERIMGDLLGNDAYVSECGKYRYELQRYVGAGPLTYAFFGINPSTADASKDDQTVRKWRGFSERNNVGRFVVGNVFSYRATDVKELARTTDDLFGDDHWRIQEHIIKSADALVPCWGNRSKVPSDLHIWIDELMNRLIDRNYRFGTPLLCFGHTASGDPKHPLTLGYNTPLIDYQS